MEITTASTQTPSDLSKHNLLTLGFPSYGSAPGTAIVNYVDRVNLDGIKTVIISCAGGTATKSIDALRAHVQTSNGTFLEARALALSMSDSSETSTARQAGSNIIP
ncbi:hypothetical protein MUP37_04205 [Candidatus Bathyarchaeota archaeon]|nr:hypothetical protein [Candidatus Bathyarchaeota archaeon]